MGKTIEIQTAQQVVLSYELASVGNRMLASVTDIFIQFLLLLILGTSLGGSQLFGWLAFIVVTCYHFLFETFMNGRSPGKLITGIRVMRTDGATLGFTECFLRWIMRPLDIGFSAGALAIFLAVGSEKSQRLGDLMAGTAVVKGKYGLHYRLSDLQKLHESRKEIEIQWPQLRHIEEKHILLIKNTLHAAENYTSQVYERAIFACAEKMAALLELQEIPANPRAFLHRVVDEYIVITR
ncbi:MAG: RDD family protein [Bacteroidetes bacterium]|nr:RDD family protein [Bacteroidota bacterium]